MFFSLAGEYGGDGWKEQPHWASSNTENMIRGGFMQ
jgi:hypothetical protein